MCLSESLKHILNSPPAAIAASPVSSARFSTGVSISGWRRQVQSVVHDMVLDPFQGVRDISEEPDKSMNAKNSLEVIRHVFSWSVSFHVTH